MRTDLVWTLYPINKDIITVGRISFNTQLELFDYLKATQCEEYLVKLTDRGIDPVFPNKTAKIDVCPDCGSDSKKKRLAINLDAFNAWFPCQYEWHEEKK